MLEVIALLGTVAAGCGYDGSYHVAGYAKNPDTSQLVYCEYHLPHTPASERTVIYLAPSGERIVEKRLSFARAPQLPTVEQVDFRNGEQRQVLSQDNRWLLRYRPPMQEIWEQERIAFDKVDVIDAGFDSLIRQRWQALMGGESETFQFASAVHQRALGLRVAAYTCPDDWRGQEHVCLRVAVQNLLIRAFAPDLRLVYHRDTRRLLMFAGVTNVLDGEGKSQELEIYYRYPQP